MNGLLRSISSGVLALALAGAGLPNVLVAQAANTPPVITSIVLTPESANEGQTVRLDVTFTDPDADVEVVTVRWGDGFTTVATLAGGERSISITRTYPDDSPSGSPVDELTVTVTVDDGGVDLARGTGTVTIHNVAPVLTAFTVAPAAILDHQSATAVGSFDDPGLSDSHTVDIDWGDGDKTHTPLLSKARRFSLPHLYLVRGTFTVTATVTDDDTGVGTAQAPIAVSSLNTPPSDLLVTVGAGVEGSPTTLAVSFVDPDAADTHTVSLAWGDGTAPQSLALEARVTSFSPTHVYQDSGSYTASVTVADSAASTPPMTVVVLVANVAPTVTDLVLTPPSILEQESVRVDVTFADPGVSDTFALTVAWGDGTSWSTDLAAGTRSASASHQYLAAGSFGITATVTDRDNATGAMTRMLDVRSRNRAPSGLVLRATSPDEGDPATLTGSFTDLDTTDTHTVSVTWGDGATGTVPLGAGAGSFSATHTYAVRGTYHVNVAVTDAGGLATNATVDVVVQTKKAENKIECDRLTALEQWFSHQPWANSPQMRALFERAFAILRAHYGCDDEVQGDNGGRRGRGGQAEGRSFRPG